MKFKTLLLSAALCAFATAVVPAQAHEAGDPVAPALAGAKHGAAKKKSEKSAHHGQLAAKHAKKAGKAAKAKKVAAKHGKTAKHGKGAKPSKSTKVAKRHAH